MRLVYHGGNCCGINHIHGFDVMPEAEAPSLDTGSGPENVYGSSQMPYIKRPAETFLKRLDFYIEYIKNDRTSGMIEVVLAGRDLYDVDKGRYRVQNDVWGPLLIERGFVKDPVTFFNSNTDNRVHRYHLFTGQERYADAPSDCDNYDEYELEDYW